MANNYDTYNDYLQKMQDQFLSKAETIEYNPTSASALKSALAKAMRPEYEKAIKSREKTAAKNRAAIDTDAAARGMGSSTWVTDVKNRQNDAAASDIAGIEGDYTSTLYNNLLTQMGQQEAQKLSVDQFNATQRQGALDRAQAATDQWWQTWRQKPTGGPASTTPYLDRLRNTLTSASLQMAFDNSIGSTGGIDSPRVINAYGASPDFNEDYKKQMTALARATELEKRKRAEAQARGY